uniref:Thiol-transferase Tc52 n=1 Tax=Ganoderma boninense TaxID=34458 RepID=A0A5K1K356_9APHY
MTTTRRHCASMNPTAQGPELVPTVPRAFPELGALPASARHRFSYQESDEKPSFIPHPHAILIIQQPSDISETSLAAPMTDDPRPNERCASSRLRVSVHRH